MAESRTDSRMKRIASKLAKDPKVLANVKRSTEQFRTGKSKPVGPRMTSAPSPSYHPALPSVKEDTKQPVATYARAY